MNLEKAALAMEKLGHPKRLEIYRLLVRAGPEGLPVGALQEHLGIPGSTLTHHLSHLIKGEVILQERQGRVLRCLANFELVEGLMVFLKENCCQGVEEGSLPKLQQESQT